MDEKKTLPRQGAWRSTRVKSHSVGGLAMLEFDFPGRGLRKEVAPWNLMCRQGFDGAWVGVASTGVPKSSASVALIEAHLGIITAAPSSRR